MTAPGCLREAAQLAMPSRSALHSCLSQPSSTTSSRMVCMRHERLQCRSTAASSNAGAVRGPQIELSQREMSAVSLRAPLQRRQRLFAVACTAQRQQRQTPPSGGILQGVRLAPILVFLFAAGFLVGPPMDGFHTNVDLLQYDKLPITIGTWKTSLADPLLLGTYYAVAGPLILALDDLLASDADRRRVSRHASPAWVALSFGLLAAYLQLSAVMYGAGFDYSQIWAVLAAAAIAAWRLTDGTRAGLLLALVSALVCPVAELGLTHFLGLWHYPRADLFGAEGIVTWTACCYAYYTVVVGNLARWIASETSKKR